MARRFKLAVSLLGLVLWPGSGVSQRFPHSSASAANKISNSAGSTATVFATDLRFPRGLKFGPDNRLYVAESGLGGIDDTIGICDQDPVFGPFHSGHSSRISSFDLQGNGRVVVDNLP